MKIWKYPLLVPLSVLTIPRGGKVVALQAQRGQPCLWVEVDPEATKELRGFRIYGTGREIPDEGVEYVGTYQDRAFVWHVYEELVEVKE